MSDQPHDPGLAPDPLAPKPRREMTPEEQSQARGDPWGPQELGTDEVAGGADSSPYENVPTDERDQAAGSPPHAGRGSGPVRNG